MSDGSYVQRTIRTFYYKNIRPTYISVVKLRARARKRSQESFWKLVNEDTLLKDFVSNPLSTFKCICVRESTFSVTKRFKFNF